MPKPFSHTSSQTVLYEFKAPYDGSVKIITGSVIAGLLALTAWISYLALSENEALSYIAATTVSAITASIPTIPYLYSPKSYAITTEGVLVKRL